jgi:CheY-like chemotaxis protein
MARVLVADDDPDTAETFARLLALWGHEARACFSVEEALALAAAFLPDVALVDLSMPGLSGAAVARLLARGLGLRPRLLAMTGLPPALVPAADAALFERVLYKPVEPAELRALLEGHARELGAERSGGLRAAGQEQPQ